MTENRNQAHRLTTIHGAMDKGAGRRGGDAAAQGLRLVREADRAPARLRHVPGTTWSSKR